MPDTERLRAWFDRSFVGRTLARLLEARPLDLALALASRAFVALIPAAMLTSSFAPGGAEGGFGEGLVDRFELEGTGAAAVETLFATPTDVRSGTTVLGIVILVYSVLSFARMLARIYEGAWHLPPAGVRGILRGLVWVAGFVAFAAFVAPARNALADVRAVGPVFVVGTATLLWLWTPYVLLAGRVAWRRLVPTGVLTAVGLGLYTVAGTIYLPEAMSTSAERYGLVGVAFALLSWLIGTAVVLVVCAGVGAIAGEGRLGDWLVSRAGGRSAGDAA